MKVFYNFVNNLKNIDFFIENIECFTGIYITKTLQI